MENNTKPIIELKSIAKGGTQYFFGNIFGLGVNLVYNWYLARLLGADGLGVISLILSTTMIFSIVSMFGLRRTLVRFIASYREDQDYRRINGAIIYSFSFVLILSVIVTIGLSLSKHYIVTNIFHEPALLDPFQIVIFSIPFSAFTTVIVYIAQAFKKANYQTAIENVFSPLLRLVLTIVVFRYLSETAESAAYGILIANILATIVGLLSLNKIYSFAKILKFKPIFVLDKLINESWPLLFVELINRTQGSLGILMLGILSTSGAVGVYKVSVRVTFFIRLFFKAINTMFSPIIASASSRGDNRNVERILKIVTRWSFTVGFIVFLFMFGFGELILSVFGSEFIDGILVLRIVAVSELVLILIGPLDLLLTMTGHPKLNLINSIILGVITITINILLIPKLGPVGAAIGTAAGLVVLDIIHVIQVNSKLGIGIFDNKVFKPIIAGLITIGITLILNNRISGMSLVWHLALIAILMVMIYMALLIMFGLENEDKDILQQIWQRLNYALKRE